MSGEISSPGGGGYVPPPPTNTTDTTSTPLEQQGNINRSGETPKTDFSALAADLKAMIGRYQQGANTGGTPGVSDSRGAPEIEPSVGFSFEELSEALTALTNKTKENQINGYKADLTGAQEKIEQNTLKSKEKLDEWCKKCAEAANSQKVQSILGWVGAAVGLVASIIAVAVAAVVAVAACVASAGAATPLAVAAVIGCVVAVGACVGSMVAMGCQVANEIGSAMGADLKLSGLSSLVKLALTAMLKAQGVDEKEAEKIAKALGGVMALTPLILVDQALAGDAVAGILELSGVSPEVTMWVAMGVTLLTTFTIGLATAVLSFGAGIGSAATTAAKGTSAVASGASAVAKGASTALDATAKVTKTAAEVAKEVSKITKIVGTIIQGLVGLTKGGLQVAQGGVGVATAVYTAEANTKLEDKKRLEALRVGLQALMNDGTEEIKKLIKEIDESLANLSDLINSSGQSRSQLNANIGGGRVTV